MLFNFKKTDSRPRIFTGSILSVAIFGLLILTGSVATVGQSPATLSSDNTILTIDDAPEIDVIAHGKTIVIKKRARGVLAFGGDIIVEGTVDGDVAAIGGSVFQKKDAFIGGEVLIFGGKYVHEAEKPLRNEGRDTIMYAGYEDEMRNIVQNPTEVFSPSFSTSFFIQRIVSVLFWFIISLLFTTIAPGVISRASAKLSLSALKVTGIGLGILVIVTILSVVGIATLPNSISMIAGTMIFLIFVLAYVYGRVALQVIIGRWLTSIFGRSGSISETIKLLIGVVGLTIILSIPYLWPIAVILMFSAGLGLTATMRNTEWKNS